MDFFCPKCRSRNVVVEMNEEGYYEVCGCDSCGFVRG